PIQRSVPSKGSSSSARVTIRAPAIRSNAVTTACPLNDQLLEKLVGIIELEVFDRFDAASLLEQVDVCLPEVLILPAQGFPDRSGGRFKRCLELCRHDVEINLDLHVFLHDLNCRLRILEGV